VLPSVYTLLAGRHVQVAEAEAEPV